MHEMFAGVARAPMPSASNAATELAPQLADSVAAFRLIRSRAGEWHIDADRIGMIGFSAGAMLTMATALSTKDARPAFIGDIYGPLGSMAVPADAPLFAAIAADDPLFGNGKFSLIDDWRMAHRPVEFHLYERGGHGFGMYQNSATSTGWFDSFTRWLDMHGLLKPKTL